MNLLPLFVNVSFTITQCINSILHEYTKPTDTIIWTTDTNREINATVLRIPFDLKRHIPNPANRNANFYISENVPDEDIRRIWNSLKFDEHTQFNPWSTFLFIDEDSSRYFPVNSTARSVPNVLLLSSKTGSIYTLSTSFEKNSNENYTKLLKLGECGEHYSKHKDLFSLKALEDREIIVVYYPNSVYSSCDNCSKQGIEIEFLKLILDYLKKPYKFISLGKTGDEHPFMVSDIVIGGIILSGNGILKSTHSYVEDFMKLFVPPTQRVQRWRYILLMFNPTTWLFCCFGFVVSVIVFILLKYERKQPVGYGISDFMFIIFLGRTKRFRTKDIALEFLIFSMVFLSFMVNNLFGSRLTFLLYGIIDEEIVKNTEDIVTYGFSIGTTHPFFDNMLKEMPELANFSHDYFVDCRNTLKCFERVVEYNDIVFFASSRPLRRSLRYSINPNTESPYLRELKNSHFTKKITANMNQHHPFFETLNNYVLYLIESGITDKIIKKYDVPFWTEPDLESTRSLKFEHIVAPLIILAVGLKISLIAFFCELMIRK